MTRRTTTTQEPKLNYENALIYLKKNLYKGTFEPNFFYELMHCYASHLKDSHTQKQNALFLELQNIEKANWTLYQNAMAEYKQAQSAYSQTTAPKSEAASSKTSASPKNEAASSQAKASPETNANDLILETSTREELAPPTEPKKPALWLTKEDTESQSANATPRVPTFYDIYKIGSEIALEHAANKKSGIFSTDKTTKLSTAIYDLMTKHYWNESLARHISETGNTEQQFQSLLKVLQESVRQRDRKTQRLEERVGELNQTVLGVQGELKEQRETNQALNETLQQIGTNVTFMLEQTMNQSMMIGLNDTLNTTTNTARSGRLFSDYNYYPKVKEIIITNSNNTQNRTVCITNICFALRQNLTPTIKGPLSELLGALLTPTTDSDQTEDTTIQDWLKQHLDDIPADQAVLKNALESHQILPPFCFTNKDEAYDTYLKHVSKSYQHGHTLPQDLVLAKHFNRMRPSNQKSNGASAQVRSEPIPTLQNAKNG